MTLPAVRYAREALAAAADPEKAAGMQAYMKTDMPFYGVQKPGRVPVIRHIVRTWPPADRREYEELVLALWCQPHREEKYVALGVARGHARFITPASLPLYRRLVTEGAWWDLVDEVATRLVRRVVVAHPEAWAEIDRWIEDSDMWLRRAAILSQIGAKDATDAGRLFDYCRRRMHEREFFIRKAIGWALREYSKTDPGAVAGFVREHRDGLSGLSYREATKHIGHLVGE
jgi:3-methyladenine DNA glycosylase AlkD